MYTIIVIEAIDGYTYTITGLTASQAKAKRNDILFAAEAGGEIVSVAIVEA